MYSRRSFRKTSNFQNLGDTSTWAPYMGVIAGLLAHVTSKDLSDSLKIMILGSLAAYLMEGARRLFQWLIGRFRVRHAISARFDVGDPAYEWITLLLTQDHVWESSRNFRVTSRNSTRKWDVKTGSNPKGPVNAEYVPTFEESQVFLWRGYWVEVTKAPFLEYDHMGSTRDYLVLRVFTFKMSVLSDLVEDARRRYIEDTSPHVTVHLMDRPRNAPWTNVKRKHKRPMNSLILDDSAAEDLLKDARSFLTDEPWYRMAGIPHRRGYLLHGPPGTGKTSTIYALAGELGLEIYSLSLSSRFVDDGVLQRAASAVPKGSVFLMEDIDCAFTSREDQGPPPSFVPWDDYVESGPRGSVTLSGLLNVIDGVGSEEGNLFFATTNYFDRLDPALIRPGRIDVKVQYRLSSKAQAEALFTRFFSIPRPELESMKTAKGLVVSELAAEFAKLLPEYELSVAALQGHLFSYRTDPFQAVDRLTAWVEKEREETREREEKEQEKKQKRLADRALMMNPNGMMPQIYPIAQPLPNPGLPVSPAVLSVPGEQSLGLDRAVVIKENGNAAPPELGSPSSAAPTGT